MLISTTLKYLPAQTLAPFLQIVLFLYWTFHLPSAELGFLNLAIASQELFSSFLLVWWQHYVLRFLSQHKGENFIATEFTVMTFVVAAHVLCMQVFVHFFGNGTLAASTHIAALAYATFQPLAVYLSDRARALHSPREYTFLQLSGPAFGLAASFIAFMSGEPIAAWPLAGLAFGYFLGCAYDIARRSSLSARPSKAALSIVQAAFRYGGPLIVANVFIWVIFNIGRYVIDHVLGTAAVGQFSVGYGLGMRALSIAAMLVVAAGYPLAVKRLNESGPQEATDQLRRNALLVLALVVPAAIGLVAVAPHVTNVLVGAEYRDAALIILPLAAMAGAIRSVQSHIFEQCLLLFRETRVVAMLAGAMALATTAASIALIYVFGIAGILYALLAVQAAGVLTLAVYCRRKLGFTVPLVPTVKIVLASLTIFVPVWLIGGTGPVSLVLAVAGGGAIYVLVLFALFREDGIVLLKRLRRPA